MPNSEPARAAGMGRLWLRLVAFFLLLAIAWAGLEWGMARMPNSHSLKRDRLRALAGQVDTLILGSSEAYYGIAPHQLSGTAFNLANSSQSLYYDEQVLKRVLPELPHLKRVIILVGYMTLYFELYDHPESWRQYQYYQEWHIPLQRKVDYFDLRPWSRVALYTPHTALEALRKRFRMSLAPRVDDRGWYRVPDEDRWGLGTEEAQGRLAVHHGFMREQYLEANAAALERIVALLRGRGIEVVMVTTPVWPTYQAGIRTGPWERAKAVVEGLARKYGARYLNFQHEPRLPAEDFEDSDHLNADGASHFARMLDETLGPPRAEQEPSGAGQAGSTRGG